MVKYILAVDGSSTSDAACQSLLKMLHRGRDKVFVVSTSEPMPFGLPTNDSFDRRLEEATRTMQEPIERDLQVAGIEYELHQVRGHAGESICQFAEEHDADMIVMGTRGLSGFWKWVSGSTSEYVLAHTSIPVTVVAPNTNAKVSPLKQPLNHPLSLDERAEGEEDIGLGSVASSSSVKAAEQPPLDREYYRLDYNKEAGAM